jgi:crotonobetainyl-CoA:carnitine CoA-transferase CaiB-like acyl-CoA transferase
MTDAPRRHAGERHGGPLEGLRVVDISDSSGRLAGALLGEMGADVVRLRPGEPGPAMTTVGGGVLDWWFEGHTSSLPLDLDRGADRDRFLELVAEADVLVETEPPGRLAELGLDAGRLAAVNPGLVHVSLTPFGLDGPRAGWQSSDLVMAAAGGILSVNGVPDEPVTIWGRQMDNLGGWYAAICALSGVVRARATGRGTHFDLSHQQAVVSCSEHVMMFWWWPEALAAIGAPIAARQASLHWSRAYEVVPCARGFCMVSPSAGGVPDLLAWMAARGHPPIPPDDATDPVAVIESLMTALREFAVELDATDVFEGGQARHVPFGEVLTVPEVVSSPQHLARGFLRPVGGVGDEVRVPGPFARFSATPCPPLEPPTLQPMTAAELDALLERWSTVTSAARSESMALPLTGVRVIDFTHVLAGPFATRVLADLGADVIKIQTDARAVGGHANEHPYFAMWNRSKSSIALNMADDRAVAVLRSLVEQSDVVIENFSAGVLDSWGAGWSELSSWNDQVVYVSMQGAGTDGPWRDYVTFAPTVHALSGLTALTGPEGRTDCGTGVALNDHASGLAGALAVLAALEARRSTGRGQHIDLSQLELASYLVGPALIDWRANGREALAAGTRDAFADPVPNDVVRASDGVWLAATARDDGDWRRLADELGADDTLDTLPARRLRRVEVHDMLAGWAAGRSAAAAVERLQAAGIPAAVVQNAADLTGEDPQLRHRDWVVEMASAVFGVQHTDRFPATLTDSNGEELAIGYRPSPYLGEHNFDVYATLLGLDEGEIAERIGDGLFT